jgi:hypothetical protein
MSTPSHSDNPFHGFSTRQVRFPVDPPGSSGRAVQSLMAPMPPLGTILKHPSPSASSYPLPNIPEVITNPFAVGHPTGLQTVTAHALASSGSNRRSSNPFNPLAGSSLVNAPPMSPLPNPNLLSPIGFQSFLPPTLIPPLYAPPMTPPAPPVPLMAYPVPPVAPLVTLQDTINMFTTAFTQLFAQVQH